MNYGYPTTRRFPRSLQQAFPHEAEYAESFFPHEKSRADKLMQRVAIVLWIGIGLYFWRTV